MTASLLRIDAETPSTIPIDAIEVDPTIQSRAAMNADAIQDYAAAMARGERFPRLVVFCDEYGGRPLLAEGFHRLAAARLAGLQEIDILIRVGDRRMALFASAGSNTTHGLRRSNGDKWAAVAIMVVDPVWSEMSNRAIADHTGTTHPFVAKVRASLAAGEVGPPADVYEAPSPPPMPRRGVDLAAEAPAAETITAPEAEGPGIPAVFSSASVEWYTPRNVVEAARATMGGITLDPASCKAANAFVQAAFYFSPEFEQDGLERTWGGRVFLNPPYGLDDDHKSNQGVWTASAVERWRTGEIEQAIILVNAATDTAWFWPLWEFPVCLVRGRLRFWRPWVGVDGAKSPTHANALVYLPPAPLPEHGGRRQFDHSKADLSAWAEHFGPIGRLVDGRPPTED